MIGVDWDGDVVTIELQREKRRNALNTEMLDLLRKAVEEAAISARVIVLTGQGPMFCSGADLDELSSESFTARLLDTVHVLDSVAIPVIAVVNGAAYGAGVQLALAADLRVVAPDAHVAIPVAEIGIALDRWTIHRLVSLVGAGPARTMLFGAERLSAADMAPGFANKLGTLADAQAWAGHIAGLAPLTLRHLKLAFNDDGTQDGESSELRSAQLAAWVSRDAVEGIAAKQEKRAPKFIGR